MRCSAVVVHGDAKLFYRIVSLEAVCEKVEVVCGFCTRVFFFFWGFKKKERQVLE